MHVERLLKVKEAILAEPRRVNMDIWYERRDDDPSYLARFLEAEGIDHVALPPCGSIGCIGGWAEALFVTEWSTQGRPAFAALGLTRRQGTALCFGYLADTGDWPLQLRKRLDVPMPGTKEYARVVADAIDDFIATNCWGL